MVIAGLTGSIAMGKTTAARQLRRLGVPVHDADRTVHEAMAKGGEAVVPVAEAFPGVVSDGEVDRAALGQRVYEDPSALRRLEGILHPLVRRREERFLRQCARARARLVTLDIPLLFETGGDRRVDAVIVVTAPDFLQKQRVLRRPGMTEERLERIREQQMDDAEKCRRADFLVHTGLGKGFALRELEQVVRVLRTWRGRHVAAPSPSTVDLMREIALDTETTGLDPGAGHRIIEIAAVELINHVPSGAEFHRYVNPERDVPQEAYEIHGLDEAFLAGHPVFAAIAEEFLSFIGDSPLVIHNAEFDLRFINAELKRLGAPPLPSNRAVDTLAIARRKYPGAQASLDALCRRFEIDLSGREKHGALIDTHLLAEVYLELIGGRQPGLTLVDDKAERRTAEPVSRPARPARPHQPSADELAAHTDFLDKLTDPIWRR